MEHTSGCIASESECRRSCGTNRTDELSTGCKVPTTAYGCAATDRPIDRHRYIVAAESNTTDDACTRSGKCGRFQRTRKVTIRSIANRKGSSAELADSRSGYRIHCRPRPLQHIGGTQRNTRRVKSETVSTAYCHS